MSEATWRRKVARGCASARRELEPRSHRERPMLADNGPLVLWGTLLNQAPEGAAGKRRHEAVLE